ncbi:MAG: TIGR01620 family protein [Pseudomonadota bacterium]
MTKSKGPVLIDLEDESAAAGPPPSPADAPPIADGAAPAGDPAAMQRLASLAAAKPRPLARAFWSLLGTLVVFFAGLAAWSVVASLIAQSPVLGMIATILLVAFVVVCAIIVLREVTAFARLARIDKIRAAGGAALADHDLAGARKVCARLSELYAGRPDLRWGREALTARLPDAFDADTALGLAETELLAPLDVAASREVEAAARQVATVTALVPLAFADVVAALTANLRMIRRIAEVYGGRSGALETWRLTRAVLTHLVATGAVAVGDDLIGSVAGGSVLSRVSRRFGEGVVNGALTARVGVAAIEVCRPLPFVAAKRPSVTGLVKRALTGLFASSDGGSDAAGAERG